MYHTGNADLRVKGTIIQFEKEFMYYAINHNPHFVKIKHLFQESQRGVYFAAGSFPKLQHLIEKIPLENGLNQLMLFLKILKEMSETDNKQIIPTTDFINETIYDAAMNSSAFCRYFKSKTGKSFKNYILDMRIGYVCKLLLMKDISISQLSSE